MINYSLLLLIWEALKLCGLDYVGSFTDPAWAAAMPFVREAGE